MKKTLLFWLFFAILNILSLRFALAQTPPTGTVTFQYQTGTQTNSPTNYADFVPTSTADAGLGFEFITQCTGASNITYPQVSYVSYTGTGAGVSDATLSFDRNSTFITVTAAYIRSAATGAATTQGRTSKPNAGGEFRMTSIDLLAINAATTTVSLQAYRDNVAVGSPVSVTGLTTTARKTVDLSTNSDFYNIDEIGITGFSAQGIRVDNITTTTALNFYINSPADGTTYSIGSAFTFTNTNRPTGTTKVEYYSNGSLLGTSSTSPYSLAATATTGGAYSIIAKAYNSSNTLIGTSPAMTINVYPPAPTTTAGSRCGTGTVLLGASGTPSGGTFYLYSASSGGSAILSSTSTTFSSPSISATTTYYVSYAVGGIESTSRTAVIATVNTPPTASFTATSSVYTGNNATVTLTSTYSASNTYSWDFGGGTPSTGTGQGPFSVQWSTSGTKTITLTVTSSAGCATVATQNVTVLPTVAAPTDIDAAANTVLEGSANGTLVGLTAYSYDPNLGSNATNLALGKTVTVSSYEGNASGTYNAAYTVDGATTGNRWSSLFSDPQYLVVDLGANYDISRVKIYWEAAYGKDYLVQVSTDNSSWVTLTTVTGNTSTTTDYTGLSKSDGSSVGRYVRIYGTARGTGYGYSIYEIQVYRSAIDYTLTNTAGGRFTIDGATGVVSVANGTLLDYDNNTSHTVTVQATNGSTSASQTFTIAVTPNTPNVAYATPQTYSVGTAVTLSPTNTGGTPSSYSVSPTLPSGLSINTTTGVISGTPTVAASATVYTVTATNVTGSSSANISITVNLPVSVGNYAFNQSITLKTGSMGITSTLNSFPVLVYIKEDALKTGVNCANNIQYPSGGTNGYDFAFTTSSGTNELYYQVESFDSSTGTLLAWVQLPTVTNADQTLKFYFGSTSPNHPSGFTSSTWASDYLAVYHFSETPSSGSTTADATSNGRTGTTTNMVAADLVTGKIGTAYNFNGSTKAVSATSATVTGAFTLSAWVYLNALNLDQKVMTNQAAAGGTTGGYKLGVYTTNIAESESGTANNRATTTPAAPTLSLGSNNTTNWYYLQNVYTGTTLSTYVNGVATKTLTTSNNPTSTSALYIGAGEGGTQYYFNGRIDEPRVSNVAKSADWLKAEYYNQNNYLTFTTANTAITGTFASSAPLAASLVYTWTGATSTSISTASNWTSPVSGNAALAPPTDGTASLVIPSGLSRYPVLTANAAFFGVTLSGATSKIDLNGFTMTVGCNIYNSAGGQITSTTSATTAGVTWNGVGSSQTYTGSTTSNTAQIGIFTLNNSAGGTLTLSGGPVDIYNQLVITSGNLVVGATTTLTLKSTATLTASIPAITSPYSITGNVTAERYMAGGTGKRGYRLLSSPVSNTVSAAPNATTGLNSYNLTYLQNNTILTGPAGNGFTTSPNNNPTVFVYKESDALPFTRNISVSDYKGFASVTEFLPIGNGILYFFRGNQNVTKTGNSGNAFTSPYPVPENTTLTFTGTVNSGNINVYVPVFSSTATYYNVKGTAVGVGGVTVSSFTTNLPYTDHAVSSPTSVAGDGFNLIGNPYPSTIDLEAVTWGAGIGTKIYTLNSSTQGYGTYVRSGSTSTDGTALNGGSRYVLSGEGFFVKTLLTGAAANRTVSFAETAKTAYPSGSFANGSPKVPIVFSSLGRPQSVNSIVNNSASVHIKLVQDSVIYNETLLTFGDDGKNGFDESEDAVYLTGPSQTIFMYSNTTDGINCVINKMSRLEKITAPIKLYAAGGTTGIYKLTFGKLNIDPYYRVYLKDAFTKDSLDITANDTYNFNIDRANTATYGADRFTLVVRKSVEGAYKLITFTGSKDKLSSSVKLNWEVKNESDVVTFNIERSTNGGKSFVDLGTIQSSGKGVYTFNDNTPDTKADNIYRLKQADVNDAISYSDLVAIKPEILNGILPYAIVVYPNPTRAMLNIKVSKPVTKSVELHIINSDGKMVRRLTVAPAQSFQQDVSDLQPGAYIIDMFELGAGQKLATTKFIKVQ